MMNSSKSDVCPLCESTAAVDLKQISYTAIWEGLEKEWNAVFSQEVISRHSPCERTTLVECKNCGLQYFIPMVEGDSQFYHELSQSPTYYNQNQWEFSFVQRNLVSSDRVLDIGCGEGFFLRGISQQVAQATGIDTNPSAIGRAQAAGLDARLTTLEEFSRTNSERFSVVCCFHVMEHLKSIGPFVRAATSCLKTNGTLIVSVPHRRRILQRPLETLDCPPHHISRWDSKQLIKLAEMAGLSFKQLFFEVVDRRMLREWVRENIFRVQQSPPPTLEAKLLRMAGRLATRLVCGAPLYYLYQKAGWLEKRGLYRSSVLAVYQKTGTM